MDELRADMAFGKRLKHFREAKGLSQTELGERLGLSYQQIQKYEAGKSRLSVQKLQSLCAVLGVLPSAFFPEEPPAARRGRAGAEGPGDAQEREAMKLFRSLSEKRMRESLLFLMRRLRRGGPKRGAG